MYDLKGLSVVICTRNRPNELEKCVVSVLEQNITSDFNVELLIIDDGDLPEKLKNDMKKNNLSHIKYRYYKKCNPGLLLSRIKAVELSNFDLILFLDDDVVLDDRNYLNKLVDTYKRYPEISGLGGIDKSISISKKRQILTRIIGYDSGSAGRLSRSSYGGSMHRWLKLKEEFNTEFLHGCNMSFKKSSLLLLQPVEWLKSYSLAEDIYLSQFALKKGPLMINPALTVQHNHSPVARDKLTNVSFTEIVNHYYLLRFMEANWTSYLAHIYTSVAIYVVALFKSPLQAKGYKEGIKYVINKLRTQKN